MIKALKITVVSVICLFLIIAVAGYIVLNQIDFNQYKEKIVSEVKKATGRDLAISNIGFKMSFNPVIELENVSFSNAEWAKNPTMVQAKAVGLGFAILPLLHKSFVIDKFIIDNAVVNLEETANGKANWNFENNDIVPAKTAKNSFDWSLIKNAEAAESQDVEATNDLLSSLVIKKVALNNVKINYTDKSGTTQVYDVKTLTLDENVEKNIDFVFNVNDGLYGGNGVLGALDELKSKEGYPIKANVDVMGIKVSADMLLFNVLGDLAYKGSIQSTGFMGKGSSYKESADVYLEGDLKKAEADIKSLNVAGNVITGKVTADMTSKTPVVNAVLDSARIDIAPFMANTKTAFILSFVREAQATSLAPAKIIPYAALYNVNANANVSIARVVKGNSLVAENLGVSASVNNGSANIKITRGKIFNGDITANASLKAQNKSADVNFNISKMQLSDLMSTFDIASSVFNFKEGGNTDISVKLNGNGNTYADIVDNLDGQVILIVDKSQLRIGNIGLLKGNIISQLFNTLGLTKGNDDLSLNCAVVRSDLKKGVADFPSGIVLNADKFTLVANGDINLKNDKLNFSVKPFAGKLTDTNIAKLLSSLIKLSGTIQNPSIGVDEKNVVKNIVGMTTTGPVYLGAQMLMEGDSSVCYTALSGTGYESRFPKPMNAAETTTNAVGDAINDSVGLVKDTAQGIFNLLSGGGSKK